MLSGVGGAMLLGFAEDLECIVGWLDQERFGWDWVGKQGANRVLELAFYARYAPLDAEGRIQARRGKAMATFYSMLQHQLVQLPLDAAQLRATAAELRAAAAELGVAPRTAMWGH